MLPTPSMELLSITFSSDRVEMKNVPAAPFGPPKRQVCLLHAVSQKK